MEKSKLVYFVIALLPALVSCGGGRGSIDSSLQRVRPVKSTIATSSEYVARDFVGLSTPAMAVNLAFKISGQILSIPVGKGDLVERGDLLCEIDPRDVELQLISDRSNYDQARSAYERAERLVSHDAISQQELERLHSSYLTARSIWENSREMLLETTILAPFRSVVERVYVDRYQRVQAGEVVVRIVSPTTSIVEFTLPESYLSQISDSLTRFEVRFDNFPNERFEANVDEYARTSSDASGFPVSLRLVIPSDLPYIISSGLSCTITMITVTASSGAVVLPLTSIYSPISGGTYLWVVDSVGRVEPRLVELGGLTGQSSVVVERGVESGERVVTAGVYQLRAGERVKLID